MSDKLDLSPFRDALEELKKMHARSQSPQISSDPELFRYLRTAVIKGFEYTYELSAKFMARFLEVYGAENKAGEKPVFRALLRQALAFNLITGDQAWLDYRAMRNAASHGYQKSTAEKIYAVAPALIKDAEFTLTAMERHMQKAP